MALLAYNKTTSPLTMAAGNPAPVLPASLIPGQRGNPSNVTTELRGLTSGQYTAIKTQILSNLLDVEWTEEPEYPTPTLINTQQPTVLRVYNVTTLPDPTTVEDGTLILFSADTPRLKFQLGGAWYTV